MIGVLWLATMLASDAPWMVITGFWAVAWIGLTLWGMKDLFDVGWPHDIHGRGPRVGLAT